MNVGGNFFLLDVRDNCTQNPNNVFECIRVGSSDQKYNPNIFKTPYQSIFSDRNDGSYSTTFSVPSLGWVSISTFLLISTC